MFVILNVIGSGKRKVRRGKTVDQVYEYSTGNGERFYIIDVLDSAKGVNWDDVAYFTGKHGKAVLLDRRYALPEFSPIGRFEPLHFKNVLLFNTLNSILKQLYLHGERIRCRLYDPEGLYAAHLPKLVRFACETTVVTNKDYRYFAEADSLYCDYGASVRITREKPTEDDAAIILDTVGSLRRTDRGCLFSVAENGFTPSKTDGLQDLKTLCPPYIDPLDFLGAVYEKNHDRRPGSALCRTFRLGDQEITVPELTEQILRHRNENTGRARSIIFYV